MASRFWVLGTGTWDASSTVNWSATSGGSPLASVPGSGDSVIFDGSSGGGVVTINTPITVLDITCGAFTGTLDFSANNNNVTLSSTTGFVPSGTGVRTINLGNGTWSFTSSSSNVNLWNCNTTTNLTLNANGSTIVYPGSSTSGQQFLGGGKTYNNFTVAAGGGRGGTSIQGANTWTGNWVINAPNTLLLVPTQTITGTITLTGTSSNPISLLNTSISSAATISKATGTPIFNYVSLRGITFSGGATFSATNSQDLGFNSGITITPPSNSGGLLTHPGMQGGARG